MHQLRHRFTTSMIGLVGAVLLAGCGGSGLDASIATPASGGAARAAATPTAAASAQPAPGSAARGTGRPLTGAWQGTLRCDADDSFESDYEVAASGNPVLHFMTRAGQRKLELTHVGQTEQFLPPAGGVTTLTVEALAVSDQRIRYTLRESTERTSGGTLSQSDRHTDNDAVLANGALQNTLVSRGQSTLSQPGIVVPGSERVITCRGPLHRS